MVVDQNEATNTLIMQSGVFVIFVARSKKAVLLGLLNEHCSVCGVAQYKEKEPEVNGFCQSEFV